MRYAFTFFATILTGWEDIFCVPDYYFPSKELFAMDYKSSPLISFSHFPAFTTILLNGNKYHEGFLACFLRITPNVLLSISSFG